MQTVDDQATIREQIARYLAGQNKPIGPRDLADAIGANYNTTRQEMANMKREGSLETPVRGGYEITPEGLALYVGDANKEYAESQEIKLTEVGSMPYLQITNGGRVVAEIGWYFKALSQPLQVDAGVYMANSSVGLSDSAVRLDPLK